jgi:hypothetical protein
MQAYFKTCRYEETNPSPFFPPWLNVSFIYLVMRFFSSLLLDIDAHSDYVIEIPLNVLFPHLPSRPNLSYIKKRSLIQHFSSLLYPPCRVSLSPTVVLKDFLLLIRGVIWCYGGYRDKYIYIYVIGFQD